MLLLVYWLVLIGATHAPRVPEAVAAEPADKIAHLAGYAILGGLLGMTWSLWHGYSLLTAAGLLAFVAAHAALDEVTQPWFGRYADITDWYADIVGAAIGLAVVGLVWRLARRRIAR